MDSTELISAVKEVNKTLNKYESFYSFAKRLPTLEEERCMTFRQWIEVRLNNEIFWNIPELSEYEEKFSGELFEVVAVLDQNEDKCRFREVQVKLTESPNSYIGDDNFLDELENVKKILKGSSFKFNYSQKKTKVEIL